MTGAAATRSTAQYRLVAGIMADNYGHPTADEVYAQAREEAPNISRGTVYRNLNRLADEGVIARLTMPSGPDHYDCATERHTHFLCRSCNRVFDTQLPYDVALDGRIPGLPNCKVEWHRLILVGLCADCLRDDRTAP